MTQADFATACGVGKTAQYTYEANDRHPDILYIGAAMAAGVDVGYLMTGKQDLAGKLYAAGKIADGVGEHLVLEALGNLDLYGFEQSLGDSEIEAVRRSRDLKPMVRKLIAHNRDLREIFDARPAVDVSILEAVLLELDRSELAKALPASKRAKVAALAYRLASKHGTVDRAVIEEASALATAEK